MLRATITALLVVLFAGMAAAGHTAELIWNEETGQYDEQSMADIQALAQEQGPDEATSFETIAHTNPLAADAQPSLTNGITIFKNAYASTHGQQPTLTPRPITDMPDGRLQFRAVHETTGSTLQTCGSDMQGMPESPVPISVEFGKEGIFAICTDEWFRYDRDACEWVYGSGGPGGWDSVTEQPSTRNRNKHCDGKATLLGKLESASEREGYGLLRTTQERHEEITEIELGAGSEEDKERVRNIIQEEFVKRKTGDRKEKQTTPTTDPVQDAPPAYNHLSDARCGENKWFVKLCYDYAHTAPSTPTDWKGVLARYIRKTASDADGYHVIAYEDSGEDRAGEPEGTAVSRARRVQNEMLLRQASLEDAGEIQEPRPVLHTPSYADMAAVEDVPTIVLASDDLEALRGYLDEQGTPGRPVDQAFIDRLAHIDQRKAPERMAREAADQWHNQFTSEGYREDVQRLREKIKESTGITVRVLERMEPWPTDNPNETRRAIWREKYPFGTAPQTPYIENVTSKPDPAAYAYEPEKVDVPCTSYVLTDPEGVYVYENQHCQLTPRTNDFSDETEATQVKHLLESALAHTERPRSTDLLLYAHRLTERGKTEQARSLAVHVKNAYTDERTAKHDHYIILAEIELRDGDPNASLDYLDKHMRNAAGPLRTIGAQVAIKAAQRVGGCPLMQRYLEAYRADLTRSERRAAYTELEACQREQARQDCKVLEDTKATGLDSPRYVRLVFINDGIYQDQDRFNVFAQQMADRLLGLDPLDDYADSFSVKTTRSQAALVSAPRVPDEALPPPPRVDTRLVHSVTETCPADHVIVYSDENFYPSTYAGAGVISRVACADGERCMNIYQARSLAFSLFELDREPGTVTADLDERPGPRAVAELFSPDQDEDIERWFRNR